LPGIPGRASSAILVVSAVSVSFGSDHVPSSGEYVTVTDATA
jgi:hypothetical protein